MRNAILGNNLKPASNTAQWSNNVKCKTLRKNLKGNSISVLSGKRPGTRIF